jgi:hypothetical protein
MRKALTLLCLAIPASAQHLTIGAEGGLRLTGDSPDYGPPGYAGYSGSSDSKPYLVGPKIEVGLPLHFALEADVLYSRLGNTLNFWLIGESWVSRTIANSWAFPVLVKYRLPVARTHPFLSLGFEPRYASGKINTINYGFPPFDPDVTFSSVGWHAHDQAWVLGAGIGIGLWKIRITPELRYLRCKVPASPSPDDASYYLTVPQNEGQLLLGIEWPVK